MFKIVKNCSAVQIDSVPVLSEADFRAQVIGGVARGEQISALFACNLEEARLRVFCVLSQRTSHTLAVGSFSVGNSYMALTPECPQAHWFEREIFEQWGISPVGHPWLKPIRFQAPFRDSPFPRPEIGVTDFFRLEGEEVHQVAVGPVHAGIIEPGHFRFQCHGENVYHLEISLGYQHRGVERALFNGPHKTTVYQMETLAGDTSIGHTTAYCHNLEALSGTKVPSRAQALRSVMLELERLANHTGDMGALANDVGYLPTASFCGRIRGDFLNMSAVICGNRFGRGMVRAGGVQFDIDEGLRCDLLKRLEAAARDVREAVGLLWESPAVMARFERTGTVAKKLCHEVGLVGLAARACGQAMDCRTDFPHDWYSQRAVAPSVCESGDVFARAYVRWLEIQSSISFVREVLNALPQGEIKNAEGPLAPCQLTVSMVEGWRGEVCHVAITNQNGRFAGYKVVDPSFHNWFGLALALRNQQISDFPLCNKSFNLSYCGHDL